MREQKRGRWEGGEGKERGRADLLLALQSADDALQARGQQWPLHLEEVGGGEVVVEAEGRVAMAHALHRHPRPPHRPMLEPHLPPPAFTLPPSRQPRAGC